MNEIFLGVDTSNYTTSLALCQNKKIIKDIRKILPVESGKCGLRQSDALFYHIKALPELSLKLFDENYDEKLLTAVGFSAFPRDVIGSYMPCFLAGNSFASAISNSKKIPFFKFSHQSGHIMSALYKDENRNLLENDFISFHISGGTSEVLRVSPNKSGFSSELLGGTSDLNVGQAIDRLGVKLGYEFPCGRKLDQLSLLSDVEFNPKVSVKDLNFSISGLQNQCEKMLSENHSPQDIAKFLFTFIAKSILKLCENLRCTYPNLPILFAGGVMSNTFIRNYLKQNISKSFFALPELSRDNACGIALLCEESFEKGAFQ